MASLFPGAPPRRVPDPTGVFLNDGVERPACRTCGSDYEGVVIFGEGPDWLMCLAFGCGRPLWVF